MQLVQAAVAELADACDSKSHGKPYGSESHQRHYKAWNSRTQKVQVPCLFVLFIILINYNAIYPARYG